MLNGGEMGRKIMENLGNSTTLNGGLACRKTKVFVGNSTLFGGGRIPLMLSSLFGGGITI